MDDYYLTKYVEKLRVFVESEFNRLDLEMGEPKKSFTFSIKHCIRGTTAVWGRAEKIAASRHLMTVYSRTLRKLITGEFTIAGYNFEQVTAARKATYRVTRIPKEVEHLIGVST